MTYITKCMNDLCAMKNDCLRYTSKPNEGGHQSRMYYVCEGREWHFLPNNK